MKSLLKSRWIIGLACLLALLGLVAANLESAWVYEMVYARYPRYAQKLRPEKHIDEANGIRLTLLSTEIEGNIGTMRIEMKDVQGNRLNQALDMEFGHDCRLSVDYLDGYEIISHDKETSTAIIEARFFRTDGKSPKGCKASFSLEYFQVGETMRHYITAISPAVAQPDPPMRTGVDLKCWSWSDNKYEDYFPEEYMVPGNLLDVTDTIHITAVGYVDGLLRVQTRYDRPEEYPMHGHISLRDPDGWGELSVYGMEYYDEGGKVLYVEDCFAVPPDKLDGYTFVTHLYPENCMFFDDLEITTRI